MRLVFSLVFVFCFLLSYDFSICQRYYKDASAKLGDFRVVHIQHNQKKFFVGFFKTPPKDAEIIKSDPFIGLYAIRMPHLEKQTYMLMPIDSKAMSLNMANINFNQANRGIILKPQEGFLKYAKFSNKTSQNSVISNICYQIYGIGIHNDLFIDSKYLNRFLEQDTPYYGDIGVRLYPPNPKEKTLKVQYVDPFFPNVPFLKDDEILSINGEKIKSYYDFEWLVSNLEEFSIAKIKIKRKKQILNFDVEIQRRYGGFLLPDVFFDRIGIKLNDQLEIISTDPHKDKMQQGLLKGDVILWINGQKIFGYTPKSPEEIQARVRDLLTQAVSLGKLDILISRDGFQFTLNLINGLQNEYIKARYNPFGF